MSTQQAFTVVGGVIGAYFGSWQAGAAIGGAIGGAIDPVRTQGPRIGEAGTQTTQEGAPRPIIYGTHCCSGNVIESGPLLKTYVEDESAEGKGGGPINSSEHAYRTYAVRICEGPIAKVLRIWRNGKLVYDIRPESLIPEESEQWIFGKGIYLGDEEQLPDPFLQINLDNDDIPAYRGTAYMVFVFDDLTETAGAFAQYRFEVATAVESSGKLAPLVVFDWVKDVVTGQPIHEGGDVRYKVGATEYLDFSAAATAAAAAEATSVPAAFKSKNYLTYATSTNPKVEHFDGGATLADDPQNVLFKLSARAATAWENPAIADGPILYCSPLQLFGVMPDDGKLIGLQALGGNEPILSKLSAGPTGNTEGGSFEGTNNCTNYPPGGAYYPVSMRNPLARMSGVREPTVPDPTWTKVVGTAKQLCAIEYRDGVLYQNAVGPVLLPDDPDYNNNTFWAQALAEAVDEGLIADDVTTPVVVSAYAEGASQFSGLPTTLGAIVSDIHDRCQAPRYDVSELTDSVDGLLLAGDYTGADAINTLRAPYFFDKAEPGDVIKYVKRGGDVAYTFTYDDLVDEPDQSQREQAIEYPRKIHLQYQLAKIGYDSVIATSMRSSRDAMVVGERTVQVPVVINENIAAQIASKLHKTAWEDANGEVKFSVPLSFLAFIPTDIVGLNLRDNFDRLRIEQADLSEGVISFTCRYDRQSAYTSTVTGVVIPDPAPPPSTIVGDTVLAVLDISSRVDSEDDLNYYVAAAGESSGWYGARVQRSLNGGATYVTAADITSSGVIGTLVDPVANASEHYTDATNTVRVQLTRPTLTIEDITDTEFLSEGGAFAVENPDGSWELMQYRDATDEGDGVFALSMLHRGRLASGPSAHLAGALFVMLTSAKHVDAQSAWIGQELTHRAVTLGTSGETAPLITETYLGRSQIEWPVASLELSRIGSNITATWAPRHRFGTDDNPIPAQRFDGYRVTFDDGVLAPYVTTTPDAFVTFDATAYGPAVTVTVQALNQITGAGPATSGTI